MKVTHLNSNDLCGGAAKAAYRLHTGLRLLGIDSGLLVQYKQSSDPTVICFELPRGLGKRLRRDLKCRFLARNQRVLQRRPPGSSFFSDDRSEHDADVLLQIPQSDVLNLHWVAGFIDYRKFFPRLVSEPKIVWTLHDMNPFTGGCHYNGGCTKFQSHCGACPQLSSSNPLDFSSEVWIRKSHAFSKIKDSGIHVVTPSRWLAEEARKSSLFAKFPSTVIPNGVDTNCFQPRDRQIARERLNIPQDSAVVLFVADWANESRKGFSLLVEALQPLKDKQGVRFLMVGRGLPASDLGPRALALNYVADEEALSFVYSAADIFVIPSLQDNLPNTVLEALACGVPVAAFQVGGILEIIRDGIEGRLVNPGDVVALRSAICQILHNDDVRKSMMMNARKRALQEYRLELQAIRYVELYRSLMGSDHS